MQLELVSHYSDSFQKNTKKSNKFKQIMIPCESEEEEMSSLKFTRQLSQSFHRDFYNTQWSHWNSNASRCKHPQSTMNEKGVQGLKPEKWTYDWSMNFAFIVVRLLCSGWSARLINWPDELIICQQWKHFNWEPFVIRVDPLVSRRC